jgi:hypothetical protein
MTIMPDLKIEDATPEELLSFQQHERSLEIAMKRAAESKTKAKADAKNALLAQLEKNKRGGKLDI